MIDNIRILTLAILPGPDAQSSPRRRSLMRGKLATVIEQIAQGHHVFRAYSG
jgi:hypothetical protein